MLDGNKLAQGHAFFAIGGQSPTMGGGSPTRRTLRDSGNTRCISRICDWRITAGTVERVGSVVWAADGNTLFYTVEDEEQKRQYQLWRHVLGESSRKTCWYTRRTMSGSTWARPHARRKVSR